MVTAHRTVTPEGWMFPAIRGVQAGREFFTVMVPLRDVPRLLAEVDATVAPEKRAQRALNKSRVPKIAEYLLGNPEGYVFSALTGTINGHPIFEPTAKGARFGTLAIPRSMAVNVLDGQHRRAGIAAALAEERASKRGRGASNLGDETVPVVLYEDPGLGRAQQMFADLNGHGARVAGSLSVLYDHRDGHANLARAVVQGVPVFRLLTEGEKAACSGKSPKLFTLGGVHAATKELVTRGDLSPKEAKKTAIAFWNAVSAALPAWQSVAEGSIAAADLRTKWVHAHAVGLHAIGRVGGSIIRAKDWEAKVAALANVDWLRTNEAWEGRSMVGGQMSKSAANVVRTANYVKRMLGLELGVDDLNFETSQERGGGE